MHELSLCQSIVELIEDQAGTHGFSKVITVRLEIGALAGVEVEAMRFAFPEVAKGGVADGARLEIIESAGLAYCPACQRELAVSNRYDACSHCAHHPLTIIGGDAMRIKDLEVA